MPADLEPRLTDAEDAELAQYRALSGLAVTGLIFGLLSPVWMIDPLLWVWVPGPVLGTLFSGLALWQIKRRTPTLIGRKAALAGLTLSLLFGTAAPTSRLGYRWVIGREARRFAGQWFDFLSDNQPQKAFQLTLYPKYRLPLDDKLWDVYREGSRGRDELQNYVSGRLVRTLLALGKTAQVRYYQTTGYTHGGKKDIFYQVYAVTYEDQQARKKKTFFVSLTLERFKLDTGQAEWQLTQTEEGFKPVGL